MKYSRSSVALFGVMLFPVLLIASSVQVFSVVAPAFRTGAPGEMTCADGCHNDFLLNSGMGSVSVSAPAEYSPGELMNITVRVSDPDAIRFGFSVTAKDASNASVGTWDVSGPGVRYSGGTIDYVSHDDAPFGAIAAEWVIPWTAPNFDAGTVMVYAAGNAADGGGDTGDDHIYTSSLPIQSRGSLAAEDDLAIHSFTLESVFPNPFVDRLSVHVALERPERVTLEFFDLSGRRWAVRPFGLVPAGMHEWVIKDLPPSSGATIYRIRHGGQSKSGVLIRTK